MRVTPRHPDGDAASWPPPSYYLAIRTAGPDCARHLRAACANAPTQIRRSAGRERPAPPRCPLWSRRELSRFRHPRKSDGQMASVKRWLCGTPGQDRLAICARKRPARAKQTITHGDEKHVRPGHEGVPGRNAGMRKNRKISVAQQRFLRFSRQTGAQHRRCEIILLDRRFALGQERCRQARGCAPAADDLDDFHAEEIGDRR
jgi:hypothetical protein